MPYGTSRGKDEKLQKILAQTAPGTSLRHAINNIVDLGRGGLLLIAGEEKSKRVVQSCFDLHTELTPTRLVELSKMDRAIVIDEDLKTILYANAYLVPDPTVQSEETGTRHLTAEKVAKQLDLPTIAISASKGRVTIYCGQFRHTLMDIITLTARANQAIRILEQYRVTYDDLSRELTALELEGRVLPYHIANFIQTIIQMLTIQEDIEEIFIELGEEKELMELQLDWLMLDVLEDLELVINDFKDNRSRPQTLINKLRILPPEDLLSTEEIIGILGYEAREEYLDEAIDSHGYRVMSQIPRIPPLIINRLVKDFGTLTKIMSKSEEELMEVKGIAEVRARAIRTGLQRLKRSLMLWD